MTGIGNETKVRLNNVRSNLTRVLGTAQRGDLSDISHENIDLQVVGTNLSIKDYTKINVGHLESGQQSVILIMKNNLNGSVAKVNLADLMAFIINSKELP